MGKSDKMTEIPQAPEDQTGGGAKPAEPLAEDTVQPRILSPAEEKLATMDIKKLVLTYSLPTIVGMLLNALYNVVDRFWVGQMPGVGTSALTGIGLCMPMVNIIMGFSMLVGIGAAANISIYLGRKDHKSAEHILSNALTLTLILSVLVTVLGEVFTPFILGLMKTTETAMTYAFPYCRIIIGGSVFQMVSFSMNHPIRAAGNPKRFASTQLLGAVANMVLDPIFIFVFHWGVAGAAIATILSQALSMVWVLSFYYNKKGGGSPLRIRFKNLAPNRKISLAIFSIGLSPFLLQILASVITIVANASLMHYGLRELGNGDLAVGAMTVISSISTLFFMPIFGINQGTQPIIGFNYGEGNYERVKSAFIWGVFYSVVICCIGFLIIMLFAPNLIWIFNKEDPDLIRVGAVGLQIFLFMLPLNGFQVPSTNFFQSIGRAKISIFLSLLRQCIILIPAYLLLPLLFGFKGLWYAGPLSDGLASVVTVFFIVREFRLLRLKMQPGRQQPTPESYQIL